MDNSVNQYWKNPKSFNVGQFTDLSLHYQSLNIAINKGFLNIELLRDTLPERVKGLKYISNFQKTTFEEIIRELSRYKFIKKDTHSGNFKITSSGQELISLYAKSKKEYEKFLTQIMHETYIIPGWFINRLWAINPNEQGQIIIPAPIKEWKPESREWKKCDWDSDLNDVVIETYNRISKASTASFPIKKEIWINSVISEYNRLSVLKPRIKKNEASKIISFSQRRRLSHAMRNSTVKIFFSNEYNGIRDFFSNREPINPRTYMVWCPRLETMKFLFYTDYNANIPGRIIFPTSVFKNKLKEEKNFISFPKIKSPSGNILHLFSPQWDDFKKKYYSTLFDVYQHFYNKDGIIYISLQDVRDEVCRLLRISAQSFEEFLSYAYQESLKKEINYSIALETDIRDDQKNAYQAIRRAVIIDNTPYSLIAIKPYK